MSTHPEDAFEVCLAALSTGVDLESCLALYPDLADELRPALQAAQRARNLARQDVPKAAMMRSRAKMLTHAAELRNKRKPSILPIAWPRLATATLALLLVIFFSLNGLVAVSAQSLPGDALYPVKRAAEDVSLKLAPSAEVRQQIVEDYQQRRTEEVRSLLSQNLVRNVALEGVIDLVGEGQIILNDIPVRLDTETRVSGELQSGRLVKLEGTTQPGGWIDADAVQLRFYEYAGQVNTIQIESWAIGDRSFKTLTSTHIDPALKVGDQVLVLVYSADDGTQYAQAILRIPETLTNQGEGIGPFEVEFSGTMEAISGDMIIVDGKTIRLSESTEIKGDFTIGTIIKVRATVASDGTITAREVESVSAAIQSVQSDDDPKDGDSASPESQDDDTNDQGVDHSGSNDDDSDNDSSVSDDDSDHSGDDNSGSSKNKDDSSSDDKSDDKADDDDSSDDKSDDDDSSDDKSDDDDSSDDKSDDDSDSGGDDEPDDD